MDLEAEGGRLDFYHFSLEGSRSFRGLRFWFTLKALGREGLGRLVDRTMDVARHLEAQIRLLDCFEPHPAPVECASHCFRYLPSWARRPDSKGVSPAKRRARLNRAQVLLQQAIEKGGFAWFPTIAMDGEVFFRFGIFNYLTRNEDVDAVLSHIRKTAARLGV